jgi:large subunit ribosomal protein L10
MSRQQKADVIQKLKESFLDSQATYVVGFRGLSVAQMQKLRSDLRQKGGILKVAKARLMKRAVDGESGISELKPHLQDQIGLVFVKEQFTDVAKILSDFSKKNEALNLVVGLLDSQIIEKEKVKQIASLPSKEVLLGQVCGTLNAPIVGLVRVLNMMVLKPIFALKQIEKTKK